jgi:hypothetical protein
MVNVLNDLRYAMVVMTVMMEVTKTGIIVLEHVSF